MSVVSIRAALESGLNAMSPALSTSWENVQFTPPASTVPYQQVHLKFAPPDNEVYGSAHREIGYLQVKLLYPLQAGTATVAARVELLRTTFARGNSFSSGGVKVTISRTPELGWSGVEDGRYAQIVKIRFFSNII